MELLEALDLLLDFPLTCKNSPSDSDSSSLLEESAREEDKSITCFLFLVERLEL